MHDPSMADYNGEERTRSQPLIARRYFTTTTPSSIAESGEETKEKQEYTTAPMKHYQFGHSRSNPAPLPPPLPFGDTLSHAKFFSYFGVPIPQQPTGWLRELWNGPYLPYKNDQVDIQKLLVFLEAARGNNVDVIAHLVVRGRWKEAVWIVRALLEPAGKGYHGSDEGYDALQGVVYTALGGGRLKPRMRKGEARNVAGIAGKTGLWAIKREIKRDVERRRRGLSVVLGSVGEIIARAGEEGDVSEHEAMQVLVRKAAKGLVPGEELEERHGKCRKDPELSVPNKYTDCLPTARQILAYLHTSGLVPLSVYSSTQYPRLHFLRSRIMASMSDAVWRAQEAIVAQDAEAQGVHGEHRGMEVPRARLHLTTWGAGSKDTIDRPVPRPGTRNEGIRRMEFGPYAEREVWMELVMALVNEGAFGLTGTYLLGTLLHKRKRRWRFVNYASIYPEEYTPERIRRPHVDQKVGVVEQWGLEGYSLGKPRIQTLPFTLPDWVIPGIINALLNSDAEARGVERILINTLFIMKIIPPEFLRRSALARVLRYPDVILAEKAHLTKYIAEIEAALGNHLRSLEILYTALHQSIRQDNLIGSQCIWTDILEKSGSISHPEWIVGKYLMALVRGRKLDDALKLLKLNPNGDVCIPLSSYASPHIAPGIMMLAVTTRKYELLEKCAQAVKETGGTHAMFSSLLNAYLRFGRLVLAHGVLKFMKDHGVEPDAVDVGILVENELLRDLYAAYHLVEIASGTKPSADPPPPPPPPPGKGHKVTFHEPDPAPHTPAPNIPGVKPGIGISRNAWMSVLDATVRTNDAHRTKWVLENLGVDPNTSHGMDTNIFNILLRGAVQRRGSYVGMQLCQRYWRTKPPTTSPEEEHESRGNLLSLRTVMHAAIREMQALDRVGMYEELKRRRAVWEDTRGVKAKGVHFEGGEEWEKRKRAVTALWFCWREMRALGVSVEETETASWRRVMMERVER